MTKPFARQGHFTSVDNAVFDEIMPNLSGNEWKVLSFIIRKTIGWHKDYDGIAYSQFRKGTGIKSNSTIQKSIQELLKKGMIEVGKTDHMADAHHYRLNVDYEIRVTETVKRPVTFSVKRPVTKTVNTKENIKEKNKESKNIAANAAPPPPPMLNTNGNHALNGHSGNSPRPPSSAAPPAPKKESSQHQQLMKAYQDCLGYKIRNGAADGKAAKQILDEGYTVQQVIDCYHYMKRDSFWQAKHLSLVSIHKQLGAFVQAKNGNGRTNGIDAEWQAIKIAVGQPGRPDISENALRAVQGVPGGWRRFKEQDARFMDQLKPLFEEAYARTNQQPATA